MMELVKGTDPILRAKLMPYNFNNPIEDLAKNLHEIRKSGGGVGLAANQVGINTRVLVIGMGGLESKGVEAFERSFFNPLITEFSENAELMIEGCLSFPDLFIKIRRPSDIAMTYYDENGDRQFEKFTGAVSRIIQHEVDHLDGITFETRAHPLHLSQAMKQLKRHKKMKKKLNGEFSEKTYFEH